MALFSVKRAGITTVSKKKGNLCSNSRLIKLRFSQVSFVGIKSKKAISVGFVFTLTAFLSFQILIGQLRFPQVKC